MKAKKTSARKKKVVHKPGSGRLAGIQNKATIEIQKRLKELKCDPLEFSAKILNGEERPQAHPSLSPILKLTKALHTMRFKLGKYKKRAPPRELIDELEDRILELDHYVMSALGPGSYIDPKLQVQVALSLLSYLFPKLQSITNTTPPVDPTTPTENLTDQMLIQIAITTLKKAKNPKDKKELQALQRVVDND